MSSFKELIENKIQVVGIYPIKARLLGSDGDLDEYDYFEGMVLDMNIHEMFNISIDIPSENIVSSLVDNCTDIAMIMEISKKLNDGITMGMLVKGETIEELCNNAIKDMKKYELELKSE
jgi:hypothetical protein